MRRYSHLGPVCVPKGTALSNETLKTLYEARTLMGWKSIAHHCRISRATLYRLMCGGNAHALTIESVQRFAETWRSADDKTLAKFLRRWSERRRAA